MIHQIFCEIMLLGAPHQGEEGASVTAAHPFRGGGAGVVIPLRGTPASFGLMTPIGPRLSRWVDSSSPTQAPRCPLAGPIFPAGAECRALLGRGESGTASAAGPPPPPGAARRSGFAWGERALPAASGRSAFLAPAAGRPRQEPLLQGLRPCFDQRG